MNRLAHIRHKAESALGLSEAEDAYRFIQKGQTGKPFKEAELRKFYEKTVKLPDGKLGKVTGYNIKTGLLTVSVERNGFAYPVHVFWDQVELAR